jgi:hypothetical protein
VTAVLAGNYTLVTIAPAIDASKGVATWTTVVISSRYPLSCSKTR